MDVLNTRPREAAGDLSDQLRAAGYRPVEVPLVSLSLRPEGLAELRAAGSDPGAYTGMLISSPNLLPLLAASGETIPEALIRKPWYLIGARARPQVEAIGGRISFIPQRASVDGFLQEIAMHNGARLLHLCSSNTRLNPGTFARKGFSVHNLVLYTPHCPDGAAEALRSAWPRLTAAIFASGTAVHHLFAAVPDLAREMGTLRGPLPFTFGLSGSEALKANGVAGFRQAASADNAGLIAALDKEFKP